MESNESSSSPFVSFQPRISIKLAGTPCNIRVAFNEERLLVGMLDGSVIVYDLQVLDQSPVRPFLPPSWVNRSDASSLNHFLSFQPNLHIPLKPFYPIQATLLN